MFFTRARKSTSPVVRSYASRGRIGEMFRMADGKSYVRTPYGFVKIAPEAAASISMRFAVYRLFLTFLALTTLASAFIAAVK